jgi:hypothetical protein
MIMLHSFITALARNTKFQTNKNVTSEKKKLPALRKEKIFCLKDPESHAGSRQPYAVITGQPALNPKIDFTSRFQRNC